VQVGLACGSGHFDDLQPGVEVSHSFENGQEEISSTGLVHFVFHAAFGEERPFDGADTDFGGACGMD